MLRVVSKRLIPQELRSGLRSYVQKATVNRTQSSGKSHSQPNGNVPGLSEKCVAVPKEPVGPGASKDSDYKNPEYFCYHENSFAEAEIEMAKFRLPAPSNKKKFQPQ